MRFEGAPYLEDFIRGKSGFMILYSTDLECSRDQTDYEYRRQFGTTHAIAMPANFYTRLTPQFSMPRGSVQHLTGYSLELTAERGLERRVWSEVKDGRTIYCSWKRAGFGSYQDFRLMGEYAIDRFPHIPKEVFFQEQDFLDDIPRSHRGKRAWHRDTISGIGWDDFLQHTGRDFHRALRRAAELSLVSDESTRLTPQQVRELLQLAEPMSR